MWCEERGSPLASVCGLQHGLAESQVPVMLCAVLLKVLPCHVLRGALLKFHFAKAAVFRCALGGEKACFPTHLWEKVTGNRTLSDLGEPGNKHFFQADL